MKSIILDSGPVITLSLNNLLWLLSETKKKFRLNFFITDAVRREIIDNPLNTRRFKFEALQVMNLIKNDILQVIHDSEIQKKTKELLELANHSYRTKDHFLNPIHFAEMSVVAAAFIYKADAIMLDERTTRYLIENPEKLKAVLSHKLHTRVNINRKALSRFQKEIKSIKVIRSAEFVTVSFEHGLLDKFLPELPDSRRTLLDALLWGLKLSGCAISTKDIERLIGIELKSR